MTILSQQDHHLPVYCLRDRPCGEVCGSHSHCGKHRCAHVSWAQWYHKAAPEKTCISLHHKYDTYLNISWDIGRLKLRFFILLFLYNAITLQVFSLWFSWYISERFQETVKRNADIVSWKINSMLCICLIFLFLWSVCFSALSMIGLILIALGTGGIKPCVAAFGGDQFDEEHVSIWSFISVWWHKSVLIFSLYAAFTGSSGKVLSHDVYQMVMYVLLKEVR